jgi:hypothetical protein
VAHGPAIPQTIGDDVESRDRRWEQHWGQHQQEHHEELQVGHGSLNSPQGGIDLDFGEVTCERSAVVRETRLFAGSSALRSS